MASAAASGLAGVLGEDALQMLSEELRVAAKDRWDAFERSLEEERVEGQREAVVKDQKCCELEHDLELTRRRLEAETDRFEKLLAEVTTERERSASAKEKMASLEDKNHSLSLESAALRRERDQLSAERNDLIALAERRQEEVERLGRERQALSKQVEEANAAKCNALVKAEEVKSKEVSLRYREKRLEEEREFLTTQHSALTEELRKKSEEALALRREQSAKCADLQAKLTGKTEEARILEGRLETVSEDSRHFQKRLEELAEKLQTARDAELRIDENYRQEIVAQKNLAEHYKSHCEESEKKANEMSGTVEELQGLLKQASARYGSLEEKMEEATTEHKEEISRRNEAIRLLKKELEDANELIKTLKNKSLSAETIESLSPSAAAASKLLKSGMSLTQVFSQLVACQEELLASKDENTRLNTYLEQILKEIEQRAPALKQQREEYDRAVAAVSSLTTQLEEARQEYEFRKREADETRQRFSTMTRENSRMVQQVQDLSKQVTVLVREVEAARSGGSRDNSSADVNISGDSDMIISHRLLSYRDVTELQQRNIELLAVVRELSASHEAAENRLLDEKTEELRKELERAAKQVEELRGARQRQEVIVESIIMERDMYKSMVSTGHQQSQQPQDVSMIPKATSTPATGLATQQTPSPKSRTTTYQDLEKRAIAAEAKLEELTKDFDEYRIEKKGNDELLNKELKETRESLGDARAKIMKLSSQEEYHTERFKIAQTNAESFKTQSKLLEERNNKLNSIVVRHEESIDTLRNEVIACQSKLSQAELQLQFLRQEKSVLQAAEARLVQENEVLNRQKSSSALVLENLNLVKLNMERAEDEKTMRLCNRNEDLEKEVQLLRKKVENEHEEYKQAVAAWEHSSQELRKKLEEAQKGEREKESEVKSLQSKLETQAHEVKELQEKLELAESSLSARGVSSVTRQDNHAETSAKVRDLQLQLNQSKNEVATLKEQLESSKQSLTQYKEIADSAEKRLVESSHAAKTLKDDLEARLEKAVAEKQEMEHKMSQMVEEKNKDTSVEENADMKTMLDQARAEVGTLTLQLESSRKLELNYRSEMEKQAKLATEAQEKYERELVQHAHNVEALNLLKASTGSHEARVSELEEARRAAEEALLKMKTQLETQEKSHGDEYAKLKEQYVLLGSQNEVLHDQLTTVSTQMASLQRQTEPSSSTGEKRASFSEQEVKSAEQLMQIIKYLRREKEILVSKIEVVQAESARVKSQMEHKEEQLREATAALKLEREKDASHHEMYSTKYTELLQKAQTVSALRDSNHMLREEKLKLETELKKTKSSLSEALDQVQPMKEKEQRLLQESDNLKVEVQTLNQDNLRWKERANQLLEKQQKINPDELKRLQNVNSSLTKTVSTLQNQLKQSQLSVASLSSKVKNLQASWEKEKAETLQKQAEVGKEMARLKQLLQTRSTAYNTKVSSLEVAKKDLEREKNEEVKKLREDIAKAQTQLEAEKEVSKKVASLEKELSLQKDQTSKLRVLARKFKTDVTNFQEKLKEEEAKVAAKEQELTQLKEGQVSSQETENLKTTIKELEATSEHQLQLLTEAEEKMTELETAKESMQEELDTLKARDDRFKAIFKKMKEQGEPVEALKNNMELKEEIEILKNKLQSLEESSAVEKSELQAEREKVQQRVDSLQQELDEARKQQQQTTPGPLTSGMGGTSTSAPSAEKPVPETVTIKPVKQQPQLQAHIQPTRHMPATATIRPQRGAPALIRTTQTPQMSVQPTIVSVSPNSAAATVSTSPSTLNPAAAEFVPRGSSSSETVDSSDEPGATAQAPRAARVLPRRDDESHGTSAATTTLGLRQQSQSVTKRQREEEQASDTDAESKKARTEEDTAQESEPTVQSSVPAAGSSAVESLTQEDDDEDVVVLDSDKEEEVAEVEDREENEPIDDEGEEEGMGEDNAEGDDDGGDGEEDEAEGEGDEEEGGDDVMDEEDDDVVVVAAQVEEMGNQPETWRMQVAEQSDDAPEGILAPLVEEQEEASIRAPTDHQAPSAPGGTLDDQEDSVVPGTPKEPQQQLPAVVPGDDVSSTNEDTFSFVYDASRQPADEEVPIAFNDNWDRAAGVEDLPPFGEGPDQILQTASGHREMEPATVERQDPLPEDAENVPQEEPEVVEVVTTSSAPDPTPSTSSTFSSTAAMGGQTVTASIPQVAAAAPTVTTTTAAAAPPAAVPISTTSSSGPPSQPPPGHPATQAFTSASRGTRTRVSRKPITWIQDNPASSSAVQQQPIATSRGIGVLQQSREGVFVNTRGRGNRARRSRGQFMRGAKK